MVEIIEIEVSDTQYMSIVRWPDILCYDTALAKAVKYFRRGTFDVHRSV